MHSLSAKNLSLNPIVIFLSAFDSRWKEGTLLLGWHKSRNLFTYKEDAWEQKTYLADQKLQRGIKLRGACFYTWGMKVLRETRTKKFRIKFDSPPSIVLYFHQEKINFFVSSIFKSIFSTNLQRQSCEKKIIRAMKEQSGISLRLLKWCTPFLSHFFPSVRRSKGLAEEKNVQNLRANVDTMNWRISTFLRHTTRRCFSHQEITT